MLVQYLQIAGGHFGCATGLQGPCNKSMCFGNQHCVELCTACSHAAPCSNHNTHVTHHGYCVSIALLNGTKPQASAR